MLIKAWTGAAWASKPIKVWNGTAWVIKTVKRWSGSAWVAVSSLFTSDKTAVFVSGSSSFGQITFTSTSSTTFTFTKLSGDGSHCLFGATTGTSTYIGISTPFNGTGTDFSTWRVSTAYGAHIDVSLSANWGTV